MGTLSSKDPNEIITLTFDYGAILGADTLLSATLSVELVTGTDSNPSAMLSGAAVIQGDTVLQQVQGGVDTANYKIVCTADTADGQRLMVANILPVRSI